MCDSVLCGGLRWTRGINEKRCHQLASCLRKREGFSLRALRHGSCGHDAYSSCALVERSRVGRAAACVERSRVGRAAACVLHVAAVEDGGGVSPWGGGAM